MANENKKTSPYRAYLFVILSVTLLALTAYVIWDDEFGLRPWKKYQKEYKTLKHEQLENEYKQAVAEFDSTGGAKKLAELEEKLKKAEEVFHSKEIQDKYAQLTSQYNELHKTVLENQKELQSARGQFLELEYLYIKNQKPEDKAKLEELQNKITVIDKRRKVLLENEESLKSSIKELTAGSEEIKAEIENIKKGLEDKKEKVASSDNTPIEIKQIHIRDIDKADRCESCHIGIEGTKQVSETQPYTKHPASFVFLDHHQPSQYGCTFCHRGQGRATTSAEKGHGKEEHWNEPMYEGDMTQTSCLTCHGEIKGLRGAEYIESSSELVRKYGCYGCHKLPGYEGLREVGPVLTEIGTKTNYSWEVNWLIDPKSYMKNARMPKFFFSQEDAEAIADYLFSMSGTTRHDVDYSGAKFDEKLASKGKELWSQARCNLCHITGGRGGNHAKVYAPDLSKVGSKVNKEWLFKWIKNPNEYFPETKMPRFRFSDDEIHALVEYIVSEFQDEDSELKYKTPVPIAAESIEKGKGLVQKYGCYGCHKIKGMDEMVQIAPSLQKQGVTFLRKDEMGEKIGTELSSIGSKPVDLLDFGKMKNKIPHDRLSYLKQKLRAPRSYRDDLRMPDFRLSETEVQQLATVLYGFTDANVPVRYMRPSRSELNRMAGVADYKFSGDFEKIIGDVKCTNCHSIRGIGADYAPDLSYAGSKLQESWVRKFLANPDVIRPLLQQMPKLGLGSSKVTMPRFNLGKEKVEETNRSDVDVVVNYFQQELTSSEIPRELPKLDDIGLTDQISQGKKLYDAKGCKACHQIGADGGAVGPNLSFVGSRLTPGYIFKHLENSKKFRPDIVEPNYGFTERERIYLTNYLMTLKLNTK